MSAPGDLVTLAQGLASLTLGSDPGNVVAALISSVSTQIQNFLGYQIASATYTRTFNGIGGLKILLPDRPITAVNSLTIDTVSVSLAVPPTSGFLYDTKFLYLYGNDAGVFNRGVQNIVVNYTAGFAAVPYDIQAAALNWLAAAYILVGEDPTVKSSRAGDTQLDSSNVFSALRDSVILVPPAIATALMPYKRVAT